MNYCFLRAFILLCILATTGGFMVSAASMPQDGVNTGYYQLNSNAESSAVYFDTTFQGLIQNGEIVVPVDINTVSYKTYTILTPSGNELHGYIPNTPLPGQTVILHADISPVPVENTGSLTIISDPPGALVYINGAPAGKIPLSGVLQFQNYRPGNYSVRLMLAGYETHTENVIVQPGSETTINAVLNQIFTGAIDFISFPKGGSVFLDGTYKGITPLLVENISYGAHQIRINLNGYEDWNALALVKPDVTVPVTARLFPLAIETTSPVPTSTKLGFPVIPLFIALLAITVLFARKKV